MVVVVIPAARASPPVAVLMTPPVSSAPVKISLVPPLLTLASPFDLPLMWLLLQGLTHWQGQTYCGGRDVTAVVVTNCVVVALVVMRPGRTILVLVISTGGKVTERT